MPKRTKCRHCGKVFSYETIGEHPYMPFCSERCKLLDLGMWLDEKHRIDEPAFDVEATVARDEEAEKDRP